MTSETMEAPHVTPEASTLARIAPALAGQLALFLKNHAQEARQLIESGGEGSGVRAGRHAARAYDGVLSTLFLAALAVLDKGPDPRVSLGAVGSYGRGVIAPRSDLDVRLLCQGDQDKAMAVAEAFLYPLWDLGLTVGHQVLSVNELIELGRHDPRTATTLLDWRHLAGDHPLVRELQRKAFETLFVDAPLRAFLMSLEQDTLSRHERYGASIYLLEPDIKLGAGGLRDLDVALWAARARWKVRGPEDLVRLGVLVPRDLSDLAAAREHLCRVRNLLHLMTQQRSNRLTFDQQEKIAPILGCGAGAAATETLMSAHYQHALAVMRVRELILGRAMKRPRTRPPEEKDVGDGLKLFDGRLFVSPPALHANPALALRVYVEAVKHDHHLRSTSRETIRRALCMPSFRERLASSPQAAEAFRFLITVVKETTLRRDSVLGDMHDIGLLTTMIPEFEPVVGRVHHDVYHVFTVDVHSIAAVDRLRALARGNPDDAHSLACRLATEVARPHVLFMAVLLHDVGKAIGRSNHAERGAIAAREIALRLGYSSADADEVSHLVRHHLALYHIATRRDIEDPSVVEEVAGLVHGLEGLRELYLLTYVDVSTTSPEAMNSWKAALLEQLYVATDAYLRGHYSRENRDEAVRQRIEAVCEGFQDERIGEFLESMPERYLLGTPVERVRDHVRLVCGRPQGQPRLAVLPVDQGAAAEVCFITDDRPGLLASLAAVLAANRLSVLEAQIYSRTRDDGAVEAVDRFFVQGRAGDSFHDVRRLVPKLERDLQAVLGDPMKADELVQPRIRSSASERPTPSVRTQVVIDNRASAQLTVVEVFTRDRPALLYTLASSFRNLALSIQLAKINTEGSRVADVFYVCEVDGGKIQPGERMDEVRSRIQSALE